MKLNKHIDLVFSELINHLNSVKQLEKYNLETNDSLTASFYSGYADGIKLALSYFEPIKPKVKPT